MMDMPFRDPYVSSRDLVSKIGVYMLMANNVLMNDGEFRVIIIASRG